MSDALDTYRGFAPNTQAPANHAASVTPHNTNQLAKVTRGLYIGVAGDVKVTMAGDSGLAGTDIVFKNVPVGVLPVRAKRVFATGTTASEIIGLW